MNWLTNYLVEFLLNIYSSFLINYTMGDTNMYESYAPVPEVAGSGFFINGNIDMKMIL